MQAQDSTNHFLGVVACGCTRILAAFLFCAAMASAASAQTFVVLHNFSGPDGSAPNGPLVQGFDGKLYGTTVSGGAGSNSGCPSTGCGTIFKIGRYGSMTTLHSFCTQTNCSDGYGPFKSLAEGAYGSLYGVTGGSGANNVGTVYKILQDGSVATLYTFCSLPNCADGAYPNSLIEGWDGSLYGTTSVSAGGTVFRLTPGDKLTTTHNFSGESTYGPYDLIQGTDGNLYGTAEGGNISYGGTIFKIDPSGGFSILYAFCAKSGCPDGDGPNIVQATDGNLYGVTGSGGGGAGVGTFFKLTLEGTLTTIYDFCSLPNCADGEFPSWPPIQATDGNFYGVTRQGGTSNIGTIYRITPSGTLTPLHSFSPADGEGSWPLMQGTNGVLYGSAPFGGAKNDGTVFSLDVGLGPFVRPVLTFGKVGDRVTILGTNLTGATAVSFNGTAATFTVSSATSIVTAVPAGATSGTITVTTPAGTLTSNVAFTVLP